MGASVAQSVKRWTQDLKLQIGGSSPIAADPICYVACVLGQDTLPKLSSGSDVT